VSRESFNIAETYKDLWNPESADVFLTPLKLIIEILDKYSRLQFADLFSTNWRTETKFAIDSLISQAFSIKDIHRKSEKTSKISL